MILIGSKKLNTNILIYLFWIILAFLSKLIFILNQYKGCIAIEITVLSLFILLVIVSAKRNGIFSAYTLFLAFSIFFIYSRIYFDFVGYYPITRYYFFARTFNLKRKIIFDFFFCSVFYVIFIDFGFYYTKTIRLQESKLIDSTKNKSLKRFLFFLIFLLLPLALYKAYLDIQNVSSNGYAPILDRTNYPIYLMGIGTLFLAVIYTLLMFDLSKGETFLLLSFYLLQSFSASLRGSRSILMMSLLVIVYILWKKKFIKITPFKFILFVAICLLLIILMTAFLRNEQDYMKTFNFKELIYYMLYSQGNTIGAPLLYLENKQLIKQTEIFPIIISDALYHYNGSFMRGSHYIDMVANTAHIKAGIGESIYLEILDLPWIFSIPVSILLGNFIHFLEKNINKNKYLVPYFVCRISWIFVLARFALYDFLEIHNIVTILLSIFFIFTIGGLVKYTKR